MEFFEQYLEKLNKEQIKEIKKLRELIFKTIPDIQETFDYNMPTYKYKNKKIIALAAQKNYYSLYILHTDILDKYREKLTRYNLGKGCIRFKTYESLDKDLIIEILKETTS